MENDVMRLLEHKWSLIRHIETERHWILAAFAVVSAGVLSKIFASNGGGSDNPMSYFVLFILGLVGALHSYRAAWVLRDIQLDINEIVQQWQTPPSRTDWAKQYWRFGNSSDRSHDGMIGWFLSQYNVFTPTFSVVYAWAYTVATGVFLSLSVCRWVV